MPTTVSDPEKPESQPGCDETVPGLTDEPAQPRAIVYLEPSFSLDRRIHRLEMDKRLEVHNNYISAIPNKMHKIDLISRLKKIEPHNAAHYQRQLEQQFVQHDTVIHK